ncbi:MAG: radical SAM protein [Spirochaetales bacterium]|jgi:hypothetical protein|nr:radical SAM protein [Spirochaetales bacterium]
MKQTIWFHYLASGCVTECMHCFRLGHTSPSMEIDDIELIFNEIKKLRKTAPGFDVIETPMFEVMAHSNPLSIFRNRVDILGDLEAGGISSSAHAIGLRDDWREQLEGLKELGVVKFYLTLHGGEQVHDHVVGKKGAFSLVREAVRRIHDVGMTCYTNIYLNSDNLASFGDLTNDLNAIGFDEYGFELAMYFPYDRFRQYEESRPTMDQITPHLKTIKAMNKRSEDKWDNLFDYTESAWVEKALQAKDRKDAEIEWDMGNYCSHVLQLVALSNLDVYDGDFSFPANRFGNVKSDGLADTFIRAAEAKANGTYKPMTDPRNFLGEIDPPLISELATAVGNRDSRKIDFSQGAMRMKWLDRLYSEKRLL